MINDNQLLQLIISTLTAQLPDVGLTGLVIAKSYQPTREGVEVLSGAYLVKLYDKRDGFPRESDVWDANTSQEITTQTQLYHSTFQLTALSIQTPGNTSQLTASDIANLLASLLQNSITMAAFQAQGVGILAITDVRNPYFLDDTDRYEASANFDFTLVYNKVLTKSVPYSDTVTVTLLPVQ